MTYTTIKATARKTRAGRYTLVIMDNADGMIRDVIAENIDIRDVVILEREHADQPAGQTLATICNTNGKRYWSYNNPDGPFEGWNRIPC